MVTLTRRTASSPPTDGHRAGGTPVSRAGRPRTALAWLLGLVGVLGVGAVIAILCEARPAYDASGWLVWGRQTWRGALNLDAAPSWKPLSFLFTLPFGLADMPTQMWLWIVTSLGGSVAAVVMAGRLAWRLAPRGLSRVGHWAAPLLAGAIAAGVVATMTVGAQGPPTTMGLLRQALIVTSDPLALALWLVALDRLISRRHGWALLTLWLVCLGRPEAWVFLGGYGLWLMLGASRLGAPRLRAWVVLAWVAVPLAWFLAPLVCSHSWLSGSDLDLGQATKIHGNAFLGVLDRLRTLSGRAVQVEVGAGILICLAVRDRRVIAIAAAGFLWALIEVGFALHGYSAVQRYLIEAGAPLAITGGVGAAYAVTWPLQRIHTLARGWLHPCLCGVGIAAVLGFGVALEPFAHASVNAARGVIQNQRLDSRELDGLTRLVDRAGGPRRILGCGTPATGLGWQSTLALQLGLNVGTVLYGPPGHFGTPTVYFARRGTSWSVSLLHPAAKAPASCRALAGISD